MKNIRKYLESKGCTVEKITDTDLYLRGSNDAHYNPIEAVITALREIGINDFALGYNVSARPKSMKMAFILGFDSLSDVADAEKKAARHLSNYIFDIGY